MTQQATILSAYLEGLNGQPINSAAAATYASIDHVAASSPDIAKAIVSELRDQRANLKLIASENYCSLATQLAHGNLLTDKYAEGIPHHRFYAGCENIDAIEAEAAGLACDLFGADHAFVQPHSGADANLVAFLAILMARAQAPELKAMEVESPMALDAAGWAKVRAAMQNHRLLALDLFSGGHLTHGYRLNVSGLLFEAHSYSVNAETHLLDLEDIRQKLHDVKPLVFLAGYSAYSRRINFRKMREMADEVGAVFMVDMAHFAGLVAGKVFEGDYDPVAHAHIVTSTTHKTLRGPRGGLVLCKEEFAEYVNKGCPLILGGPLPHAMAAKAVAFREALKPEFRAYAQQIVANAQALAKACVDLGMDVMTGGTDNHLLLVNVSKSYGINGRQAEKALRECGITLNRNTVPFDPNGPWYTSGLRIGAPAITSLGMTADDMAQVAQIIHLVLSNTAPKITKKGKPSQVKYILDEGVVAEAKERVGGLLSNYVLYPELDMGLLGKILED